MSKLQVQGNASGSGVITLAAPNTNSDYTLSLPAATGTVATTESTLTQFNATGSAPVYACRAWVNFNGTGTVAIRASGNVSSITDNGTGSYTVNMTTAMPDADYAVVGGSGNGATFSFITPNAGTKTTTATNILATDSGVNALGDPSIVTVAIFR
jgi:hypothetical protein